MALCQLTLKAIGCALNTEVQYLCKVTHLVEDRIEYYICVGDSSFYFLDRQLDQVKGRVNYIHLQRILVDTKVDTLFQIHLSEHRDRNMPLKMNLTCLNRQSLIHYLCYCWKTDLMYHHLEIKELPLYQYEIKLEGKSKLKTEGPPSFLFHSKKEKPVLLDERHIINSYAFFFHHSFQQVQIGCFNYKVGAIDYQLIIQVTNPYPIQVIKKMGIKSNLEQYAISYMHELVKTYGIRKYYIKSSTPYIKRNNFIEDKSKWYGWEIKITTSQSRMRQITIIILRRMFLPPLLENFTDIIIVFSSNNAGLTAKNRTDPRTIADSVYDINIGQPIYMQLVSEKCNTLSLTEEQYSFLLANDPPMVPAAILFAFTLIRYFHNKLSGISGQQKKQIVKEEVINSRQAYFQKFLGIKIEHFPPYKTFRDLINLIIKAIQDQFRIREVKPIVYPTSNFDPQKSTIEKPMKMNSQSLQLNSHVQNILNQDEDSNHLTTEQPILRIGGIGGERSSLNSLTEQLASFTFDNYIWRKKISRFLTFCIDGGLFGEGFSLVHIIEGASDQTSKRECSDLLEYCLFMFSEEGEMVYSTIPKQIEKSIQNLSNFNEQVMIKLIKHHYFYNIYLESDASSSNIYQQLMTFFLMEHNSLDIKKAVCIHIIDKLKKKSDEQVLPDHICLVLNELVPSLIYQYSRAIDTELQLYACIALQNILVQIKEAKQTIISNNGLEIIFDMLDSPHQRIVNYTITFIYNLFDGMNSSQLFNMQVLEEKLMQIVIGYKKMNGIVYNLQVVCSALTLIRKLLSSESKLMLIRSSMSKFYRIIERPLIKKKEEEQIESSVEEDNYYNDLELKVEVLGVICILAGLERGIQEEIIKRNGRYHLILTYCIDLILNLVNGNLLERAVQLVITLCQDKDDFITFMKQNTLFYNAIKFLYFDSKPQIDPQSSLGQKLSLALYLFNNPSEKVESEPRQDNSSKLMKKKK